MPDNNNKPKIILLILILFELNIDTNQQTIYKGCYNDTFNSRDLNNMNMTNSTSMSVSLCLDFCFKNLFPYAGLQGG